MNKTKSALSHRKLVVIMVRANKLELYEGKLTRFIQRLIQQISASGADTSTEIRPV